MDRLSIMGVRINNISMNEVLKIAEQKIEDDEKYIIYTPNTEIIMMCQKDEEFLNLMNKSDINVPAGKDNHEAVVEVVKKEYFAADEVPLPMKKTKHIIRKCTEDDFDLPKE